MSLMGKTALVTGGGSGIGLGIARALAGAGAKVAICGRDESKLREAAAGTNSTLLVHACDVADRASVKALFQWAGHQLGPIDILVNCAGTNLVRRSMAEGDVEGWDRLLAINATGAFYCMLEVLPQMRQRRDGLIVNVSSVAGKRASKLGGVAYCASKFAMTGLGMAVALEEASHGIRVTNVYPGEVDTPIMAVRPTPVTAEHRGRMLQPEDVAAAVLMVAELPARASIPELVIKPTTQEYA